MSLQRVVRLTGLLAAGALIAPACTSGSQGESPGSTAVSTTQTTTPRVSPGSSIVVEAPPTSVQLISVSPPPPTVKYADQFNTDGDLISGWSWLRDAAGQQTARWVFGALPGGGQLVLNFDLLATNARNGGPGFPARFWLTYGDAAHRIGPQAEAPRSVELRNAALADDPTGYTTRGTVTLNYDKLPPNTTDVWVAITRSTPDGAVEPYHVAVRSESVVVQLETTNNGTNDGGTTNNTTPDSSTGGTTPPSSTTPPSGTNPPSGTTPTDGTTPADGTTPGREAFQGPPLIVSLGDSYISGEAGRWAGNPLVLTQWSTTDALGSTAYNDGRYAASEIIPGCHRSASALIHIGSAADGTAVDSLNLACSGGQTYSAIPDQSKPGVDRCPAEGIPTDANVADPTYWNKYKSDASATSPDYTYTCPEGILGQVDRLGVFAAERPVKMVVLSIGGNNFQFSSVVEQCVMDFVQPRLPGTKRVWIGVGPLGFWGEVPYLIEDHCLDDPSATKVFSDANILARRAEITSSIMDIRRVMSEAGYTDAEWTLVVNTYPSPIPSGGDFAFIEATWSRYYNGCGFYDEDANWANSVALPTINQTVRAAAINAGAPNIVVMDISQAFDGRRLCEAGTEKVHSVFGPSTWQSGGAVNKSEWVQEIRGILSTGGVIDVPPFQKQESFHPNYWGQMALRNCVRLAYNNGVPKGGKCVRDGNGLNTRGEPNMKLNP